MILNIGMFLFIILPFIFGCMVLYVATKLIREQFTVDMASKYEHILESSMDKTYDYIYKDRIISYYSEGQTPDPDTQETILRDFVKLTFQLLGENREKILVSYYGDNENIISNMTFYLKTKMDNDALMDYIQKSNDHQDNESTTQIS